MPGEKPQHSAEKPDNMLSEVRPLFDFTNQLSQEVAVKKAALSNLIARGLISKLSPVDDDGETVTFERAFGRVEGQEIALNAIAAFTQALDDDLRGKLSLERVEKRTED